MGFHLVDSFSNTQVEARVCQSEDTPGTSIDLPPGASRIDSGVGQPPYIIYTRLPAWGKGASNTLAGCYYNSIETARKLGCRSVRFELLGATERRFPKGTAFSTAVSAIQDILGQDDGIEVYLSLPASKPGGARPVTPILENLSTTVLEDFVSADCLFQAMAPRMINEGTAEGREQRTPIEDLIEKPTRKNLDRVFLDETFGVTLKRLIVERHLPHSVIQDETGLSKVGFWKILEGKSNPTKLRVFAIAISLKLNIEETRDLLTRAGYAINPSSIEDVVLEGIIRKGFYDRYEIDTLLYSLDLQMLPGACID